jgi:ribonucleoside-diphosphate reductase alpha chain
MAVPSDDAEAQKRKLLSGRETKLPFSVNALQVLAKRYLLRTHEGEILETPEEMFQRVARALAEVEKGYGMNSQHIDELAREFNEVMASFEFTPAGRTLANAGGPTRLVSNCIVLHVEDTMESIFGTLRDAALLQKAGSGLGFPLHLMRPAGTLTKTSYGTASGPVSFLQVYNSAFGVIKQQNRHGANMAVMSVSHPDILEFIHAKDKEGDLRNFNISVGLTDEFMRQVMENSQEPWFCEFNGVKMRPRRVKRDHNWSFVSAEEVSMTARQIFQEVIESAWKTGEPGCVFLDTVNKANPLPGLGRIEACNPCGEQFLHDGDVCNLGSLNLEKFVRDGRIDYPRLRHVTRLAVQMLDNVIDLSDFPVERVNTVFRGNRRVGLGIMGFADMLYQLNIGYATPEGRKVAEDVMAFIQKSGHEMSVELGDRKGVFPNWGKSVFAPLGILRRNAAITNVPPTGTISMMFDCSGGVEPYFALAYYYKGILGGMQLSYVNKHLRRALESRGLYSQELMDRICKAGSVQGIPELPEDLRRTFVTSMDITAEEHILMQGAFQKHCDNAISKTINFPNSATREDILCGYITAWKAGCKGCTVYRDGSRFEQVLNLNNTQEAEKVADKPLAAPAAAPAPVSVAPAVEAAQVEPMLIEVVDKPAKLKAKDAELELDQTLVVGKKRRVYGVQHCPDCNDVLTFSEGCTSCKSCGFSKCSL